MRGWRKLKGEKRTRGGRSLSISRIAEMRKKTPQATDKAKDCRRMGRYEGLSTPRKSKKVGRQRETRNKCQRYVLTQFTKGKKKKRKVGIDQERCVQRSQKTQTTGQRVGELARRTFEAVA